MTGHACSFSAFTGLKELPVYFDAAHLGLLPAAKARAFP
jgi:hypothetical protein